MELNMQDDLVNHYFDKLVRINDLVACGLFKRLVLVMCHFDFMVPKIVMDNYYKLFPESNLKIDAAECVNGLVIKKTKKSKQIMLSFLALLHCFDLFLIIIQKILYSSRMCFMTAGFNSGYINVKVPYGFKVHDASSICLAISWSGYVVLSIYERNSTKIIQK